MAEHKETASFLKLLSQAWNVLLLPRLESLYIVYTLHTYVCTCKVSLLKRLILVFPLCPLRCKCYWEWRKAQVIEKEKPEEANSFLKKGKGQKKRKDLGGCSAIQEGPKRETKAASLCMNRRRNGTEWAMSSHCFKWSWLQREIHSESQNRPAAGSEEMKEQDLNLFPYEPKQPKYYYYWPP